MRSATNKCRKSITRGNYDKTSLLTSAIAVLLPGCATGAPDTMALQQDTRNKLGLSSTDEVTLRNIVKRPANTLERGGNWDATTI